MGFEVIEGEIRTIWAPADYAGDAAEQYYQGQIVMSALASSVPSGEGLKPIGAAAGASDTTGKAVPFGVVLGFNSKLNGTYNSTYKGQTESSGGTQDLQLARDVRYAEGMPCKGDPALWLKVAVIGPNTVLKGRIFNGAYGTACATFAPTAADATGAALTTATITNAYRAYNGTWFCRSGANRGIYRTAYDDHATDHTFYTHFPYGIATTDSFVLASLRIGTCAAQFDAESTYIEQKPSYSTNYYLLDVLELNLEKSGQEYAIFKFNADQFCGARA